jgi:hypothetical protein
MSLLLPPILFGNRLVFSEFAIGGPPCLVASTSVPGVAVSPPQPAVGLQNPATPQLGTCPGSLSG